MTKVDYFVRQTIFTISSALDSAGPSIRTFAAMQTVPVDEAKSWLTENERRFLIERGQTEVPQGAPPLVCEFFATYHSIALPRSYYRIDRKLFEIHDKYKRSGPVLHVGDTITYYMVARMDGRYERICAASMETVMGGKYNSVPTIWHLPLLFASLKARRLLL